MYNHSYNETVTNVLSSDWLLISENTLTEEKRKRTINI